MVIILLILTGILLITHLLPMFNDQHWIFRISEFGRIQILFFQVIVLVLGVVLIDDMFEIFWICEGVLALLIFHNVWILYPYTPLYRVRNYETVNRHSSDVIILSANVYQFNNEYDRLVSLVKEVDPDILLTMESNRDWEDAMTTLEKDYPHCKKVPLENCYGMHFYSKLKVEYIKVHFFIADDLPSIEASLFTKDGLKFTFFGVHPPPPSPTEEETSKERDGDLMAIAKRISDIEQPVIAVGDFNIVAWGRTTKLFSKISGLIDARKGRGLVPTFHMDYPLFRFPIDLLFHSKEIFIKDLEREKDIGSDHFPLFCRFFVNLHTEKQGAEDGELKMEGKMEVDKMIEEGKKTDGNRVSNKTR